MKKFFTIIALSAVLMLALAPAAMAADDIPNGCTMKYDVNSDNVICPAKKSECEIGGTYEETAGNTPCGLCCLLNTVYTVTNWIFFLMMTLAVVLIVIGGAMYMLSGGDTTKADKGKQMITYAIIGLAIALVARFVPPIVKFILGVS